jgi:hypothetical protein
MKRFLPIPVALFTCVAGVSFAQSLNVSLSTFGDTAKIKFESSLPQTKIWEKENPSHPAFKASVAALETIIAPGSATSTDTFDGFEVSGKVATVTSVEEKLAPTGLIFSLQNLAMSAKLQNFTPKEYRDGQLMNAISLKTDIGPLDFRREIPEDFILAFTCLVMDFSDAGKKLPRGMLYRSFSDDCHHGSAKTAEDLVIVEDLSVKSAYSEVANGTFPSYFFTSGFCWIYQSLDNPYGRQDEKMAPFGSYKSNRVPVDASCRKFAVETVFANLFDDIRNATQEQLLNASPVSKSLLFKHMYTAKVAPVANPAESAKKIMKILCKQLRGNVSTIAGFSAVTDLNSKKLAEAISAGKTNAAELVEAYLQPIEGYPSPFHAEIAGRSSEEQIAFRAEMQGMLTHQCSINKRGETEVNKQCLESSAAKISQYKINVRNEDTSEQIEFSKLLASQ